MTDKLNVTPADVGTAATQWVAALTYSLMKKGVISETEANQIAATAAANCRAVNVENGANLIENMVPSCIGVSPFSMNT